MLGTECPLNNAYVPVLADLHEAYSAKGVAFVGINSNVHDTPARILAHVKANKIPFPVLKDTANALADELGAKRTPEAFVLSAKGKVLYQGRIDDQIGIGFRKKEPTRRDLAAALDEVLAGKEVTKSYVEAPGWGGVNLWFQRVAEPKIAKNRLHLDLRAPRSVPDEVARLQALGATVQAVHGDDDSALTVMLDPGGNEFCVEL